jgi:hypothetical protein
MNRNGRRTAYAMLVILVLAIVWQMWDRSSGPTNVKSTKPLAFGLAIRNSQE